VGQTTGPSGHEAYPERESETPNVLTDVAEILTHYISGIECNNINENFLTQLLIPGTFNTVDPQNTSRRDG
jgi:hypothetical protein